MAIETLYETGSYSYVRDTLAGVSWFVRKRDDQVSLMNTGADSVLECEWVSGLGTTKEDVVAFNWAAKEQSYSKRWENVND